MKRIMKIKRQNSDRILIVVKSDLFCPYCGKQEIWEEEDTFGGDYYQGVDYYCSNCYSRHYLDACYKYDEEKDVAEIEAIKGIK